VIFKETPIKGAFGIEPELVTDERGYFCRIFSTDEFERHGLSTTVAQSSVSYNTSALTLRGMHYQAHPHGECKLVRCVRGGIWDVIVDVRPESATYRQWWATHLSAADGTMLYIPEGVAHGFLTLEPGTEVSYQMSTPYVPESARGLRWDDPAFGIEWPQQPLVMSERDRTYPDSAA
jgi:dTDP-4-dehydrorhamnose 3,5-epimerase